MTLDKLRELDAAASAGPWRVVRSYPEPDQPRYEVLGDGDATLAVSGYIEANAQLAALSHLLLPAFEALETLDACANWDGGDTPETVELNYTQFSAALGNARAILAQLESALHG